MYEGRLRRKLPHNLRDQKRAEQPLSSPFAGSDCAIKIMSVESG